MWKRLKLFLTINDGRFEDLRKGNPVLNVMRDFMAGLIVAMVAIPLAMGFAIASGLEPEQGIVGGAVAGVVGALWGGSKYQVYGPTAAFIPVIFAIMEIGKEQGLPGHGLLVLIALLAGLIIFLMALAGAGKIVKQVPHSIIVGFTIGIAFTIALSQLGEILGFREKLGTSFLDKVVGVTKHFDEQFNVWALVLALGTFLFTKRVLKITVFIPAPLIALGVGGVLTGTVLASENLTLIGTRYGSIPSESWGWTPPDTAFLTVENIGIIAYYTLAVVFVAAIESLLCSRMADRLANNKGLPYNPDKELFGQSMVMSVVPLLNGFPHTGALARTATNIKLGAISPLAGIFKCILKLLIAYYLAPYLEKIPMACLAGVLMYVASNMVKPAEVTEVLHMGRGHTALMIYTAACVIVTDFLTGVLSALIIFGVWKIVEAFGVPVAQPAVKHNAVRAAHPKVVRAVLHKDKASRKPQHVIPVSSERQKWIANLRQRAKLSPSAYVHDKAAVIGDVVLGDHVNVAASASVRADEGTPFFIGSSSNIQDGVVIHALKDRFVQVGGEEWAVYVGRNVSMAHDALVHGPCYIGDGSFIGFKAVVHDSVVGERCFIGIGAVVVGVEIPDGKFVPHGMIIDSAAKVKDLPNASEAQHHFNDDVVDVNIGLAAAYHHTHGHHTYGSNGTSNGASNGHAKPVVKRAAAANQAGWSPTKTLFPDDRF